MVFIFSVLIFTERFMNYSTIAPSPTHHYNQEQWYIHWLAASLSSPRRPAVSTYFTACVCLCVRLYGWAITCLLVRVCTCVCICQYGALALPLPPMRSDCRQPRQSAVAPCCELLPRKLQVVGGIPSRSFPDSVGRCLCLPSSRRSPGDWCQPVSFVPHLPIPSSPEGPEYQLKLPMHMINTCNKSAYTQILFTYIRWISYSSRL